MEHNTKSGVSLSPCTVCPRICGADRRNGKTGACGGGEKMRISLIGRHDWEEPPISGTRGSGAVFFCGCPLRCVFCQNYSVSQQPAGEDYSPERLSDAIKRLEASGVHNINLVTGGHYAPQIAETLRLASPKIPVVWNSGGYERVETLRMLEGLVDIYLPDLKFYDSAVAARFTAVKDYGEVSRSAVLEMQRQVGTAELDSDGIMCRGLLIRHLVLPSQTTQSAKILDFIASSLPKNTAVSLMRQYFPAGRAAEFPTLNRLLTDREYDRVAEHMLMLGLDRGFTQESASAADSFVPDLAGGDMTRQIH